MSKQDEPRLLVENGTLYYSEGIKQAEIVALLHWSPPFVPRSILRGVKGSQI